VQIDKSLTQVGRKGAEQLRAKIRLPCAKFRRLQDSAERRKVARLADDDIVDPAVELGSGKVRAPIETGHQWRKICELHFVVGLYRIAILDFRPLSLRDPRLK
jgi:hypothetical protein